MKTINQSISALNSQVARSSATGLSDERKPVRMLSDKVLPTYQADNGPLTARQMATIRKAAGAAGAVGNGKVLSSLFD